MGEDIFGEIKCQLKVSAKARRLSITVHPDGQCVITVPRWVSHRAAEQFAKEKASWIARQVEYFKQHPELISRHPSRADYLKHKEAARKMVTERILHINQFYNFRFGRISIRNQKTRWGSCSKTGNLNFNYQLVFLPQRWADYIIVHELCHLQELNHSTKFWELVARTIPEHKQIRRGLGKHRLGIT